MTPATKIKSSSHESVQEPGDVATAADADEGPPTRRELRRDRRRRRWGDLGLELLVAMVGIGAIAAGFLGFGLNEPTLDKRSAEGLSRATPSALAAVKPLFTLAVLEDPQGQPASLAILVPERDRSGGDIIFVPLGIMAEVASFGLRPLREVSSLGNDNLLTETVANMVGLNFDGVDVVSSDELTDFVKPLGALSVDLPTSVEIPRASSSQTGNRRSVMHLGPGPTDVNPGDLPALFAGVAGESELDRIVRHQVIWEALLGRAARDLPAGADQAGGFSSAVGALAAGETSFHV
ncbi:MAG: hypothetical protein HYR89_07630, partial [Actinobacteria bacterium]|nr:hypothetical protein [Actinomycetota bacterium]